MEKVWLDTEEEEGWRRFGKKQMRRRVGEGLVRYRGEGGLEKVWLDSEEEGGWRRFG